MCKPHKDERVKKRPRSKRELGELNLPLDNDVLKYRGGLTHGDRRVW